MYSDESSPLVRVQREHLERLCSQLDAAYKDKSRSSGVDRTRAQETINELLVEIHDLQTQLPTLEPVSESASAQESSMSASELIDVGPVVVRGDDGSLSTRTTTESDSPESAHLVVAIFWQERSAQKIRIRPKLCYWDRETHEIKEQSLVQDDCSLLMSGFPTFLDGLVGFTLQELSRLMDEDERAWALTIDLFVPIDLIKSPLSVWRNSQSILLKSRPIVIGCSDRFDPDQPSLSVELRNQMKRGWERFQRCVPDGSDTTLECLRWLDSKDAAQKNFESYSGFKCFGDWLLPDSEYLERWQELVRSGIPLALWLCEGTPARRHIEPVFASLVGHTRFDFLKEIPKIRDSQQKTCQGCVGVFYENPAYAPDVPAVRTEQQFFSWPSA